MTSSPAIQGEANDESLRPPGRHVVFTGTASGIDLSAVRRFVNEGDRAVAVDRSAAVLDATSDLGSAVQPVVADVSTWQGNLSAVEAAVDRWARMSS